MAPDAPVDVSVVVATCNRADRLRAVLDALAAQSFPRDRFEVVVVNDASTDSTAEVLESESGRGRLGLVAVNREVNGGRASAREDGWRLARAPLIAFTDDDCVPAPGWLAAGVRAAGAHPGGIVQGPTEPIPEELGALGSFDRAFSRTIRVPGPSVAYQTCNIFYPREVLERIDGFDTEAFGRVHGGEDTDLGWRAVKAGAGTVFEPEALVHHAVAVLGPLGKLRVAASWEMKAAARHPEFRKEFFERDPFWKLSHYLLLRALAAVLVPRRLWPLSLWLAWPYIRHLRAKGKVQGGGPALAPYYALEDLLEMTAALRGAVRYRTPML